MTGFSGGRAAIPSTAGRAMIRSSAGLGDDRLAGGSGNDMFVFGPGPGEGADTVTDFSGGTDKIDLMAFDIESIEDVSMTADDNGMTVDLTDIGGGSVLLAGLTTLPDAGDFVV